MTVGGVTKVIKGTNVAQDDLSGNQPFRSAASGTDHHKSLGAYHQSRSASDPIRMNIYSYLEKPLDFR